MTKSRSRGASLARLLDATRRPVYLVDQVYRLAFCNRVCLDWIGCRVEDLLGCRCRYHTPRDESTPEAFLARLCPPPAAMEGRAVIAPVTMPRPTGAPSRRLASFLPLPSADDQPAGVFVMVDPEDLPLDAPEPALSELAVGWADGLRLETIALHERLGRFGHYLGASHSAECLVGGSPAIGRIRRQVGLAMESSTHVLIVGPSGSGRQRVAGVIHYGREVESAGVLVPLDCPVLDPELIATTIQALVARAAHRQADARPTLLLVEVDLASPEVHHVLASFLGKSAFPLRVIATAREPLDPAVAEGRFPPALAETLSPLVIVLPSLADRREDLPLLAQACVERINARGERQLAGVSPEAMDRLAEYDWPGNMAELVRVIASAHERAQGVQILPSDLPEQIGLALHAAAHPHTEEETIDLDAFLAGIERELIERALGRAKGNKAHAARLLGLTRPRLYRRLEQLGLSVE